MKRGDLLLMLKEQRQYATPSEKGIIDVILDDPQKVVGMSIRELADQAYTSPSTIVRFCRSLGCDGYRDFQRALVYEIAVSQQSQEIALQDVSPEDSVQDVIDKVVERDVLSIQATVGLLDPDVLSTCADLLGTCRNIDLFGLGASLLCAQDLFLKLVRSDLQCSLFEDWHSQLVCAKNAHPDDLAIIFSYSGLTKEMVEIAQCVKERGTTIIAITRVGADSPVARSADFLLPVAATEFIERGAAMASRMSQLAVVDALYATYVVKNYESSSELFARNWIEKK